MKSFKLILLLVLSPLTFFAQQQLSGLWIGSISNDSNTVRKDQSFEIVLAEYKGKVSGYSRSTFMVNDTLYYIVKRVKGTIEGDVCEVKDDHVVSHNFPKKPEKGVKVISTFRRNKVDSSWYLAGDWKTTQTKKYYAVSGKVDLKGEEDYTKSKLFPHLEELGLDKDVPIFAAAKKTAEPTPAQPTPKTQSVTVASKTDIAVKKQDKPSTTITEEKKTETAKTEPKTGINNQSTAAIKPEGPAAVKTNPSSVNPSTTITEEKKTETAKSEPKTGTNNQSTVAIKPEASATVKTNPSSVNPSTTTTEEKKTETVKTEPKTGVNNQNTLATKPEASATVKNNPPPATTSITATEEKKTAAVIKTESKPVINNQNNSVTKPEAPAIAKANPSSNNNPPATNKEEKKTTTTVNKMEAKPVATETTKLNPPPANPSVAKLEEKKPEIIPAKVVAIDPESKKPVVNPSGAAALIAQRKTETVQVVDFVSDSLVVALYDNGEIDGDTVSVLLNGEVFIAKQGLKASAIKKTIYITPGNEELTLILYAENLGKYPPNTGLLMVYDGEERYQLRFSADFSKNASVVFRRKK